MEEIKKALREMFKVNEEIALDPYDRGWVSSIRVEASKACAWIAIAIAIVEIREQRSEEEAE